MEPTLVIKFKSCSLIFLGIVVAIASGLGVGFSVVNGGMSAMIGIAISASLLPPICNSGMNFSYGLVTMYWGTNVDRGKGPSLVEGNFRFIESS